MTFKHNKTYCVTSRQWKTFFFVFFFFFPCRRSRLFSSSTYFLFGLMFVVFPNSFSSTVFRISLLCLSTGYKIATLSVSSFVSFLSCFTFPKLLHLFLFLPPWPHHPALIRTVLPQVERSTDLIWNFRCFSIRILKRNSKLQEIFRKKNNFYHISLCFCAVK